MFKFLQVLEEVESPINGKVQVVKTLEGVRILAGGISQSGWLLKKVWGTALKSIQKDRPKIDHVLILGLGGGSAAEIMAKFWPKAKITGVDIDPLMINLGKKYLQTARIPNLEIIESDAQKFAAKAKEKFDLILVDLYTGGEMPEKFAALKFIKTIKNLLKNDGIAAFNYCLCADTQKEAIRNYELKLHQVFPVIRKITPEANIIFICFS